MRSSHFDFKNNAHAFAIFTLHISDGVFSHSRCVVAYCVPRLELWSEWMISFFLCSCMQHTHLNMCSTAESILSRREKISAYVRLWERAQPIAKPNVALTDENKSHEVKGWNDEERKKKPEQNIYVCDHVVIPFCGSSAYQNNNNK